MDKGKRKEAAETEEIGERRMSKVEGRGWLANPGDSGRSALVCAGSRQQRIVFDKSTHKIITASYRNVSFQRCH